MEKKDGAVKPCPRCGTLIRADKTMCDKCLKDLLKDLDDENDLPWNGPEEEDEK